MKLSRMLGIAAALLVASGSAQAAPVLYNAAIAPGTAAFDSTVIGAGGTVTTDSLSGLASGTSWARTGYTITSTNGSSRFIDSTYLPSGQSIGINPTSPVATSGLTFTFAAGINAFGMEIGDWATCCFPSGLYIAFDGGSTNLVALATSGANNPGFVAGNGYRNFIGAIDTAATFTTVTFYGNGIGEYLVAGGTIRYSTLPIGSVGVPEPAALALMGLGLLALVSIKRRRRV